MRYQPLRHLNSAHRYFFALARLFAIMAVMGGPAAFDNRMHIAWASDPEEDEKSRQDDAEEQLETSRSSRSRRISPPEPSRPSSNSATEDGFGIIGRTGYWASGNFGITDPLTHLEAMPYLLTDEHFFFSDLRGFVTNYGRAGGNLGAGYRYLDPVLGGWYGGSLWYDIDDSSSKLFQQIGLSGEAVFPRFELRTNVYLPVTTQTTTFSDRVSNLQYIGNQMLYSQQTAYGNALSGWDLEAGTPVPLPFLRDQDRLRIFGGGYYFLGKSQDNIAGFKCRMEAVIGNTVSTQVAFTTDRQNGSQIAVGVSLEMPWGDRHPTSGWKRDVSSPFRFVERNYNIILERYQTQGENLVAINPATGNPYFIEHVSASGSAGGNGTFESPFSTIAQAEAAGGDIVFVHSDTVVTNTVTVTPGMRVLGDGVTHRIKLSGYNGTASLPTLTSTGQGPVINVSSGPAVILASNSEFSGFQFQNLSGDGIVGQNLTNVTLRDLSFQYVAGDAISLQSLSGTSLFQNLTMDSVGGRGLVVDGGSPELTISDFKSTNASDDALVLSHLTDATVTVRGLSIDGSLGSGLVLDDVTGDVGIYNASILNTGVDALRVQGGSGTVSLYGNTVLSSDFGRGLVLDTTESSVGISSLSVSGAGMGAAVSVANTSDDVNISALKIDRSAGPGLFADSASSLTIGDGSLTTVGGAALEVRNSDLDITLTAISVDQSSYGIKVVDSTGSLTVQGGSTVGAGGTIENTTTGVILNNAGTVQFSWMKFLDNPTAIQSAQTEYLSLYAMKITGSSGYAVDSLNDTSLLINSSYFSENGAVGGGTIRALSDQSDNHQISMSNNTIIDANGTAIFVANSGSSTSSSMTMAMRNNEITSSRDGAASIVIHWDGPLGLEISSNTFDLKGANMTGVDLSANSSSSNLSATIAKNTMSLEGSKDTGFRVDASSTASVEFSYNKLTFTGDNGTGFVFSAADQASLWLVANSMTSTSASGTTGFLMSNLVAGSSVQIDSNSLDFSDSSSVVDRGFVFTTLGNTVELSGTTDNILTGVMKPLVIPSGQTTGGFYLNGTLQQP